MSSAQHEYDQIARDLRRTSRFFRVALHAHSPKSHDFGRTGDGDRNNREQLMTDAGTKQFLEELAKHLDLVAITDHMQCSYAVRLSKLSAPRADFAVLPGMEVNLRLNPPLDDLRFHILVIFPPRSEVDKINRIFAKTAVPAEAERDQRTAEMTNVQLPEFVRSVHDAGGLCVLAHLSSSNSLRLTFHQKAKDVFGLLDPTGKVPEGKLQQVSEHFKSLLAGLDVDGVEVSKPEDRKHYACIQTRDGRRRNVPVLLSLDAHSVEDVAGRDRHTHVKMTEVSFDGLRAALKMPHTRIRFKDDLPSPPSPGLAGVSLSSPTGSGFFEKALFTFSPNLNCIIGPRGSGKSTLIDALRYVFGYNRTLVELEDDAGLIKAIKGRQGQNLKDTIIRVFYRRKDGAVHVLEATYDPKSDYVTRVFTLDGHPVGVDDVEKCGDYPLRLFGWSEIETLGRAPVHQRQLVDRLIPGITKLTEEREQIRAALKENATELLNLGDGLQRLFDNQNQIVTHFTEFTNDFARLNTPEMAAQFASLDMACRKQRALELAIETFDEHIDNLRRLEPSQLIAAIEQKINSLGKDVIQWWQQEAKAAVDYEARFGRSGGTHSESLGALTTVREGLVGVRQALIADIDAIERGIRSALAADTKAQVEANQRSQAEARLAQATKAREAYLAEYRKFDQKLNERRKIVDQLSNKQLAISGARAKERDSLVGKLNDFRTDKFAISVDFKASGDRTALLDFLAAKGFLSGLSVHHKARKWPELLSSAYTPCELAQKIWTADSVSLAVGAEIEGSSRTITADEATAIVDKRQPVSKHDGANLNSVDKSRLQLLLDLEAIPWDDMVQITLNGQPVESLSPGQRSSAMLPLIALSETNPLVIDQPEDNLDIRLVGEVVAGILAKLKERRQVIAATHNSNIVVLGDAEQVIVLDAVGNRQGKLEDHGSIDLPSIVHNVLILLEGGKEAFCLRKERYEL